MTRTVALLIMFALAEAKSYSQEVRIGVLGLFHPHDLSLTPASMSALVIRAGDQTVVIESISDVNSISFRGEHDEVGFTYRSRLIRTPVVSISGRDGGAVDFSLAVPNKLNRKYLGRLEVRSSSGILTPIVAMNLEVAVASIVAAENRPDAPLEALKAQAVAARSYLMAGKGRHKDFDFCDATHCQFLRGPPSVNSAAFRATLATRDLVIAYQSRPVPAMYTRSCGGTTRTPSEIGMPSANYPFYSVPCKYCREHLSHWERWLPSQDAASLHVSDEASRLRVVRLIGWDAVPSDSFTIQAGGDRVKLEGVGSGHGIGLCQTGAEAMAKEGASFRDILTHYYPNTTLVTIKGK